MTNRLDRDETPDPRLQSWLAEGPTIGPDAVLLASFAAARDVRQERTGWMRLVSPNATPAVRMTVWLGFVLLLLVAGLAAIVAATNLLPKQAIVPPTPYGPARNGLIAYGIAGDIWVRDADGTHAHALIAGSASDANPLWSPDGSRLLFQRREPAQPTRLMMADRDGQNVVPLADVKGTDGDWTATAWSPDGRWVAVRWAVHGAPTITIIDSTGAQQPRDLATAGLNPDGWLAWLPPEGLELVFQGVPHDGGPRGLYAIRPDGSQLRTIASPPDATCPECNPYLDPALSPDGRSIAFWSWEQNDGRADNWLHVRDLATGSDRLFTADPEYPGLGQAPLFSPDGESLLWESGPHDDAGKQVLAGGTSVGQLSIAPIGGDVPAKALGTWYVDKQVSIFSPDGAAVLQDRGPGGTYVIDLASGSSSPTEQSLAAPSWQRLAP